MLDFALYNDDHLSGEVYRTDPDRLHIHATHLEKDLTDRPLQLDRNIIDQLRGVFRQNMSHIYLAPLLSGRSETWVWCAIPYYDWCKGLPVVLKMGPQDKIRQEHENHYHFVEPYLSHACCKLRYTPGLEVDIIIYQFIGGELNQMVSFADYFSTQSPSAICRTIDRLFRRTCKLWYDNRQTTGEEQNLVQLYEAGLHLQWDKVWANAAKTGIDLDAETLSFPNLPGTFINPKRWLEKRRYTLPRTVYLSMTHGDFNDTNILVEKGGDCWLIDFYRTGWSHILRDLVGLEATIKLRLTNLVDLAEYLVLEQSLSSHSSLKEGTDTRPAPLCHKVFTVVGHLRRLAATLIGVSFTMSEYYEALLLTTLNSLRYKSLTQQQAQQTLLSAALLCSYLGD